MVDDDEDKEQWLRDDCHDLYHEMVNTNNRATRVTKRGRLIRFGLTQSLGVIRRYHQRIMSNHPLFLEFGVHEGKDIARIASFLAVQQSLSTSQTLSQQQQQKKRDRSKSNDRCRLDHPFTSSSATSTSTTVMTDETRPQAPPQHNSFVVHGFDSFEGLPEDWYNGQYSIIVEKVETSNPDADDENGNIMADDVSSIDENRRAPRQQCVYKVGTFNLDGQSPQLDKLQTSMSFWKCQGQKGSQKHQLTGSAPINEDSSSTTRPQMPPTELSEYIQFHTGWFEDTVPSFFAQAVASQQQQIHQKRSSCKVPVAFVHADADLYSSTITFLKVICQYKLFVKGSIIVFDEYWNYENWQHQGEFQAWMEITKQYNIQFKYIGYHGPATPKLKSSSSSSSLPTTSNDKKRFNTYGYQSVCIMITKDME
jgi:hypothetical protein